MGLYGCRDGRVQWCVAPGRTIVVEYHVVGAGHDDVDGRRVDIVDVGVERAGDVRRGH
jgi:hypothetical protein